MEKLELKIKGNGLVAQSGGPSAVINNSVCDIVSEWTKNNSPRTLYGALYGIRAILDENFVNLSFQKQHIVEKLKHTPGAALGSGR
jgi:6-phosphofructokinase